MAHWEFRTEGFRDPWAVRQENVNGIEGAALARAVRARLLAEGHGCGEVIPEDFGWVFEVTGPEGRHLCAFALEPVSEEPPETARLMTARVTVDRLRSLSDRLLGRNRSQPGEAVPAAVLAFLEGHPEVSDLRLG